MQLKKTIVLGSGLVFFASDLQANPTPIESAGRTIAPLKTSESEFIQLKNEFIHIKDRQCRA